MEDDEFVVGAGIVQNCLQFRKKVGVIGGKLSEGGGFIFVGEYIGGDVEPSGALTHLFGKIVGNPVSFETCGLM